MLFQRTLPRIQSWLPYTIVILLTSPSLIWATLDRRVWPWDPAWYGQISVELFYTLTHNPGKWLAAMQQAIGQKPPGITWLGQFFVPIGYFLGSIETGLLLSIILTQAITLVLIYQIVYQLSGGQRGVALAGSIVAAAAPLFVGMSHQYFVEPLQTLAVAWFILIISYAPKWVPLFLASQLLAATALAMLAKMTSPLLCLGPGLVALWYLFRLAADRSLMSGWRRKSTVAALAGSLLLSIATAGWFYQNYAFALWHVSIASSGPIAEMYGEKDTFLNSLNYWLGAAQGSFFFPVLLGLSLLVVIGGIIYYIKQRSNRFDHFTVCSVIALLQISIVLMIYSLSSNRDQRYLLPLLPYLAILICWGLHQFNKPLLNGLVIAAFLSQWLLVYGQALAITPPHSNLTYWLYPVNLDAHPAMTLQAIINRTCMEADRERYSIIGVEIPWLNANSAQFFAAKNQLKSQVYCYYTSLGYAESDPERAWARGVALKTRYFITTDPTVYHIPPDALNQSLNAVNEAILAKVRASPLMRLQSPLEEDPGIFIFRSIAE